MIEAMSNIPKHIHSKEKTAPHSDDNIFTSTKGKLVTFVIHVLESLARNSHKPVCIIFCWLKI